MFDEDFDQFFATTEHAIAASYTPSGLSERSINVLFQNEYFEIDSGTVGVEGRQSLLVAKASDIVGTGHGDKFTISSQKYNVVTVRPDGTGMVELVLELQDA